MKLSRSIHQPYRFSVHKRNGSVCKCFLERQPTQATTGPSIHTDATPYIEPYCNLRGAQQLDQKCVKQMNSQEPSNTKENPKERTSPQWVCSTITTKRYTFGSSSLLDCDIRCQSVPDWKPTSNLEDLEEEPKASQRDGKTTHSALEETQVALGDR